MPSNFYIGSPDASTRPANLGPEYPTEIEVRVGDQLKKFPVAYLEKTVLKTGRYVHPKTKEEFTITLTRLDEFADKANRMIEAGIEIPCPLDHKDEHIAKAKNPYFVSSKDNLGFVVKAIREGEYLKFIQAAIGEDAALTAIRNRCSVYIKPFKDEKGHDWGTCIVHSAYTPIPVMNGLGPPTSLSREADEVTLELAREEESVMKLSDAQKKRLQAIAMKNGKSKEDAEKLDDAALQEEGVKYLESLPDGDPAEWKKQLDEKTKELGTKATELAAANSRETELKQQLAKEDPEAPTARELKSAKQSAVERVDARVMSKKFSPATGELIKEKINAEPLRLLLAREGDDEKPEFYEDLMEVAELAAKNPGPGKKGETEKEKETKLSRENPPESENADDEKDETKRMSDLAKKAGEKFRKNRRATPVLAGQNSEAGND